MAPIIKTMIGTILKLYSDIYVQLSIKFTQQGIIHFLLPIYGLLLLPHL